MKNQKPRKQTDVAQKAKDPKSRFFHGWSRSHARPLKAAAHAQPFHLVTPHVTAPRRGYSESKHALKLAESCTHEIRHTPWRLPAPSQQCRQPEVAAHRATSLTSWRSGLFTPNLRSQSPQKEWFARYQNTCIFNRSQPPGSGGKQKLQHFAQPRAPGPFMVFAVRIPVKTQLLRLFPPAG